MKCIALFLTLQHKNIVSYLLGQTWTENICKYNFRSYEVFLSSKCRIFLFFKNPNILNPESQNFNLICGRGGRFKSQIHKGHAFDIISKSSDRCKSVFSEQKFYTDFTFPSNGFVNGKFKVSRNFGGKWKDTGYHMSQKDQACILLEVKNV